MKVLAKEIEMIAYFKQDGSIVPIKFKLEQEVIKIDRVLYTKLEKFCGNEALIFTCNSTIGDKEKILEIKFFKEECKWVLFKM